MSEGESKIQQVMDSLIFSSVENIPGVNARAAFTVDSAAVFREDCDIMPSTFGNIKYMPWGADNLMPYDIIDLIERDVLNFIRYRPGTFRLWHTSATAKLFSPPKFENKKNSSGYFF